MKKHDDMPTDAQLQAVLSLVMEAPPELNVIDGWTDEQKQAALKWASAEHLRSSDNIIRRVPKPNFL